MFCIWQLFGWGKSPLPKIGHLFLRYAFFFIYRSRIEAFIIVQTTVGFYRVCSKARQFEISKIFVKLPVVSKFNRVWAPEMPFKTRLDRAFLYEEFRFHHAMCECGYVEVCRSPPDGFKRPNRRPRASQDGFATANGSPRPQPFPRWGNFSRTTENAGAIDG